jgi:hypothetical protein
MKPKLVSELSKNEERETLERIEHLIHTSKPGDPAQVFTLTPMMCERLIEKYNQGELPGPDGKWHNRTPKPIKIKEFASDMADRC